MKDKEFHEALEELYDVGETIGSGGFAKVKKATHIPTGERVAIKILDKASLGDDLPRVAREIETLKTLNHPHICKLFQVIETSEKFFMVMEVCSGGELFDYIVERDRLGETEARRFFRQIASAVAYIHARGVAHRDLKPENILLDEFNNVKLIDFGLCSVPKLMNGMNAHLETCCGSPAYAAPELIRGEKYSGPLADVWSMGVLLYALLNGFLPFDDPNLGVLYRKIREGKYEEPSYLSEGTKNILRCMLHVNPRNRLSVNELLSHTWCLQGNNEPLPVVDPGPYHPILENDVIQKMFVLGIPLQRLKEKLSKWDYSNSDTATYLILVSRKTRYGVQAFRRMPFCLDQRRSQTPRGIQKSLTDELSEVDSGDKTSNQLPPSPARPYHSSMEGGLDDCNLLQICSPKTKEDKEQENQFLLPPLPTPRKSKHDATPLLNNLSPARSADSILNEVSKTPGREKWKNYATPTQTSGTPGKRNVFGSIERGLDRFRLLLTPKLGRDKTKLRTMRNHDDGQRAFNISTTTSSDPDFVISEIKHAFEQIGIQLKQQNGYWLNAKWLSNHGKQVKFELEVVAIEGKQAVGVRRKRQNGDAWLYKLAIEKIFALSNLCQTTDPLKPLPYNTRKEPLLQTTV